MTKMPRAAVEEMARLADWAPDTRVVPAPTAAGGRTLFVGDVHGCLAELRALLAAAAFDPDRGDVVVLVGDLVGKGPDSLGVLDFAMGLAARGACHCILGNWDWALLRWRAALDNAAARAKNDHDTAAAAGGGGDATKPASPTGEAAGMRRKNRDFYDVVVAATPAQLAFVASWPAALIFPHLGVAAVHAGVNPYAFDAAGTAALLRPERGDAGQIAAIERAVAATGAFDVLHLRHACDRRRAVNTGMADDDDETTTVPWAARLPAALRYTFVFGHDQPRGLQDRRRRHHGPDAGRAAVHGGVGPATTGGGGADAPCGPSLGLDTGCCAGGRLTGWLLPADVLVSVPGPATPPAAPKL